MCVLTPVDFTVAVTTYTAPAAPAEEERIFYLQSVIPATIFHQFVERSAHHCEFKVLPPNLGPPPVAEAQVVIQCTFSTAIGLAAFGMRIGNLERIPVFVYDSKGTPVSATDQPESRPATERPATNKATQTPVQQRAPDPPVDPKTKKAPKRTRAPRIPQCFKCQRHGHVIGQCPPDSADVCRVCAGRHKTKECPLRASDEAHLCANCGGKHQASSLKCPVRPRPPVTHPPPRHARGSVPRRRERGQVSSGANGSNDLDMLRPILQLLSTAINALPKSRLAPHSRRRRKKPPEKPRN